MDEESSLSDLFTNSFHIIEELAYHFYSFVELSYSVFAYASGNKRIVQPCSATAKSSRGSERVLENYYN